MKSDNLAYGIAGIAFGLIAGWVIGSQQTAPRSTAVPPAQTAADAPGDQPAARAAALDERRVRALESVAAGEPSNKAARNDLGNLYFDAERYDDAIKWYSEALKLDPNDPNLGTDLGVSYYYTNQADKALEQFEHSLALNPKHTKTLLNIGIVKAFGKQDLDGAIQAWQQVIQIAPDGPEGQAAKRALDSMKSAHPTMGAAEKPAG